MADNDSTQPEQDGEDALEFIRADHDRIANLLSKLVEGAERERRSRFRELAALLSAHEYMEEEVIYPKVRQNAQGEAVIVKSLAQHRSADALVARLKTLEPDQEAWQSVANSLNEGIRDHIKFEQDTMLPLARELFDSAELQEIGESMRQMRRARLEQELPQAKTGTQSRSQQNGTRAKQGKSRTSASRPSRSRTRES